MNKSNLRWWIVWLLFIAAVMAYVDKNALALLAPTIQRDLRLDDQHYANIQNIFQIAYTVASLASGVIVDRIGARLSLAMFFGWWSLAGLLTSTVRSAASLGGCRFLLGLGEAGNWTASPKAVSNWFSPKERALAIGIYTAGTPVGMTLAPIFMIGLAEKFGWRSTFAVTGIIGMVWLIPWLWLYRSENHLPAECEQQKTAPNDIIANETIPLLRWTWLQTFASVEVWCLLVGRMLSDPIWYFYQNWYPKYLVTARGLTQAEVKVTWVIFLAAGAGSLVGGWMSGKLIKQGRAPVKVRLIIMAGCAALMLLSPFVALTSSKELSITIASTIVFGHLAWLTNISSLVIDVVPGLSLGKVFGLVAAGSSVGAILMNSLVAKLVRSYSYTNWFEIAAGLHIMAISLLIWGLWWRRAVKARL